MRIALPLLAALVLTGCTATDGPAFSDGGPALNPSIGVVPEFYRPPVRPGCENYAEQTARNTYENLSDSRDSFGVDAFTKRRAEQAGEQAYRRCLEGRLS